MQNPAKLIDHTNIRRDATEKDIKKTCSEVIKYGFRSICVNPEWVEYSRDCLGKDHKVCVLIDSPMGLASHTKRVKACERAKKDGADELDIVINIIDMKYERYDEIIEDLKPICKILPTKVIIGSGYLTDSEIEKASQLVKKAGAFCVKTATEKDPLENIEMEEKSKHIRLMKKNAPGLKVKASGNVKKLSDLELMVKSGADIIGSSSGVKIVKDYQKKK